MAKKLQNDEPAIEVKNIRKSFAIPTNQNNSLKQAIVHGLKGNKKVVRKVLDDVSFTINKGEFFAIVGKNGSGKSTLLKLICGIYTPDSGKIIKHGNITPFIELGVGFNPELSGRDNVYLNGALLGFDRKAMSKMYDDIVAFAELEDFMDLKLKNYSSGMQVRLAFSIAVKAKNDILIFDEVLAVGDGAFQKKCLKIFEDYRRNKQTVVLVTHSMDNVRSLCTRALMLENGKIKTIGSVKKIANAYQLSNAIKDETGARLNKKVSNLVKDVSINGCEAQYYVNDKMKLAISWDEKLDVGMVGVAILGGDGEYVFGSNTGKMPINSNRICYTVDLNLGPGNYFLTVALNDKANHPLRILEKAVSFSVYDDFDTTVGGLTRFDFDYTVEK